MTLPSNITAEEANRLAGFIASIKLAQSLARKPEILDKLISRLSEEIVDIEGNIVSADSKPDITDDKNEQK